MQRQRPPSQEQKQPISKNSNSPEAHPCKDVELFSSSMQRQKQPTNSCSPSASSSNGSLATNSSDMSAHPCKYVESLQKPYTTKPKQKNKQSGLASNTVG